MTRLLTLTNCIYDKARRCCLGYRPSQDQGKIMIVAFSRKTNYAGHIFPSQSRWIPKHASVLFYSGKEEDPAAASLFKTRKRKTRKSFPLSPFRKTETFFPGHPPSLPPALLCFIAVLGRKQRGEEMRHFKTLRRRCFLKPRSVSISPHT